MWNRVAACAHWILRCSVGTTTTTCCTVPSASNSLAMRSAKVVLPAPGVATARKSLGLAARYLTNARRCQLRKFWALGAVYARTRNSFLVEGQSRSTGYGIAYPQETCRGRGRV